MDPIFGWPKSLPMKHKNPAGSQCDFLREGGVNQRKLAAIEVSGIRRYNRRVLR